MKPSDGPKVAQLCSDRIETLCVSVQRWHRQGGAEFPGAVATGAG